MACQHLSRRFRRVFKGLKHTLNIVNHTEQVIDSVMAEATIDNGLNQFQKRLPVMIGIDQNDRLLVLLQLFPGDHFDGFIQGAKTTWKGNKTVGTLKHGAFALVHAFNHNQFNLARAANLKGLNEFRNDTGYFTAVFKGGTGDNAHQANVTGTVNKLNATISNGMAKVLGSNFVCRVDPGA
jgi:hypothetical protein